MRQTLKKQWVKRNFLHVCVNRHLHDLLVRFGSGVRLIMMQHVSQQFDVVVRHVQLLQSLRQLLRPLGILRTHDDITRRQTMYSKNLTQ